MVEEKFAEITVQKILDRAGVARSTFYAHFRNKNDVLHSRYEQMFAWLEQHLEEPSSRGVRVEPVAEFLLHIGDAARTVDALREAGQRRRCSNSQSASLRPSSSDAFVRYLERPRLPHLRWCRACWTVRSWR